MMSWKSPPRALHSFSMPASIFPQARKNPQPPNTKTFEPPPKKEGKKQLPGGFSVIEYGPPVFGRLEEGFDGSRAESAS